MFSTGIQVPRIGLGSLASPSIPSRSLVTADYFAVTTDCCFVLVDAVYHTNPAIREGPSASNYDQTNLRL